MSDKTTEKGQEEVGEVTAYLPVCLVKQTLYISIQSMTALWLIE